MKGIRNLDGEHKTDAGLSYKIKVIKTISLN